MLLAGYVDDQDCDGPIRGAVTIMATAEEGQRAAIGSFNKSALAGGRVH